MPLAFELFCDKLCQRKKRFANGESRSRFHRLLLQKGVHVAFEVLAVRAIRIKKNGGLFTFKLRHLTMIVQKKLILTFLVQIPHPTEEMVEFPTPPAQM